MKNAFSFLKNKKVRAFLLSFLCILFIVGGFYYWETKKARVFIDDSQVSAPLIAIAPTSSGRLMELDAKEGFLLKKGDTIAVVGAETIRSTTDGLVVNTNNQIGGTVSPQTTIVQLIDPSQMRVVGTLDENKGLGQIHVGQVASFTVDAFASKTYWGYVDEVSPTAKQTQLSFSISSERPTQQFQVYVRFAAGQYPEIKNGMSAKITVYTDTK
jgi:multidrug resistance efflux pump